jgi:ABC-type transport system involved in cytochrome bd biosynthesis fused ATPase/permease subunit
VINKKLLSFDRGALRFVGANVAFQWLGMLCNVIFVRAIARLVGAAFAGMLTTGVLWQNLLLCLGTVPFRFVFTLLASGMSDQASKNVKRTLRSNIYDKLTRLGPNYTETAATSEVVMLASEGVEQIDTYFAKYLPQLVYSLLAPVTLFVLLVGVHARSAIILLCCVPLIPMSIVAVQKFAKKLLAKYWGEYTTLGDSFLENIQGLTTLKIYQADGWKHEQMNAQAERFRKITMKVLTMQLNSVTLMDLMAYGGAGLGIISAVSAFAKGQLSLTATLTIVLLAADFFLPLRLLGSYFHIAMNGAASAEKIFKLLAAEEPADGEQTVPEQAALQLKHVTFGYEKDRTILQDVSLTIPQGSFVSLVGESGCGKSTIAALLSGSRTGYTGSVTLGGVPVEQLQRAQRLRALTLVPHNATIFKGTVEANLRMAKPDVTEAELWAALEQVNLADFCRSQDGLQTALHEGGSNLSGGQRQRLAMARALLHDTPIYLFDEATSNVDAESENDIMAAIRSLAGRKTVILISHRLANVVDSDCIYVLDKGRIAERGTHAELLKKQGAYSRLYTAQKQLETLETEDA